MLLVSSNLFTTPDLVSNTAQESSLLGILTELALELSESLLTHRCMLTESWAAPEARPMTS